MPRLYLITDRRATGGRDLVDVVRAALAAVPEGAALVQLRDKDLGAGALLDLARRLRQVTAARRCPLLVNDRLDVALAAGADGVHLPETGLGIAAARAVAGPGVRPELRAAPLPDTRPAFLIGASRHDPAGAGAAARAGADLIVCGPVWPTPSKPGTEPMGLAVLAEAARAVAAGQPPGARARLFALGGVDSPERAAQARAAGAHGIAAIRAWCAAADPGAATAALHAAVTRAT